MKDIDIETLLKGESPAETLRRTYLFNYKEVYISFKAEMVDPNGYYLMALFGKNIKLVPVSKEQVTQADPLCRKMRTYTGRSPCIALPKGWAKPGQLFRVIRSKEGAIWLLKIGSFSYADESSVPPEFLRTARG